jgi:EAL domain-containing protein (putative c-di-GMP-specific phosphodiesterase class I)
VQRAVGRVDQVQPDLVAALSEGLPEEQMVVHYQPQVRAGDGRVAGFEALVRWAHPTRGLLPPGTSLQAAERSGQMGRLTAAVLDRALTDLAELRRHAPGATVSVNASMRHLVSAELAVEVGAALGRHAFQPADLVLEVTEPAPGPTDAVETALGRLAGLGVRVSIHEFGVGQASTTALSRYPAIREVKIHPALAARVVSDPAAERLVRAMVQSARALGVEVVGEGVESESLAARLTRLGCDRLQGYHLHEPAPVSALLPWLRERERVATAASVLPGAPSA